MADPGIPRGGGANTPGEATKYEFAIFSQKLHEIERIWAPREGAGIPHAPLDPPLFHSFSYLSANIKPIKRQQWRIQGGTPGAPLRPKIFSISCSFSENLAKSYVSAPAGLAPPPTGNPGSAPGKKNNSLHLTKNFCTFFKSALLQKSAEICC